MDNAGRVVLPKPVRDSLRLRGGDTLTLEQDGDQITLSPVRARARLVRKQGVLVYQPEEPWTGSIPDLIDDARRKLSRDILGAGK